MTNLEIKDLISQIDNEAVFKDGPQYLEATITNTRLHDVCRELKTNSNAAFDYLFCLTGLDYADHYAVVYHLDSTLHRHNLVLKANTDSRENPVIDSVGDIWPTALAHEREVHDLLGIRFNNNPDMRRLFLEDGWGFPLRKDYSDPVRIVER